MEKLSGIYEKLQERDYKITPQRQEILKAFLDNAGRHLSAEDVYRIVKEDHPEIGFATVYRTLDLLAELEVLQKLDLGDGRARYEFSDSEPHRHHHMICVRCGRVQEFTADLLETLENMIGERTGFEVIDHEVKFFGYCKECKK